MSKLSQEELDTLILATRFSSFFGLIGSVFSVWAYLFFPKWQIPLARVVYYMSFGFIIACTARLVSTNALTDPYGPTCSITAGMVQVADVYCLVWMFFIGLGLYLVTERGWTVERTKTLDPIFAVISLLLSFSMALPWYWWKALKFKTPVYGSITAWCWVTSNHPIVQIFILHFWALLVILVNAIFFLLVGYRIWTRGKDVQGTSETLRLALKSFTLNSFVYLVYFTLTWIPAVVARLSTIISGADSFSFTLLRAIVNQSRGFLALLLYGYLTWMQQQREKRTTRYLTALTSVSTKSVVA